MKMGTIVSPWRYDNAAWRTRQSISQMARLSFREAMPIEGGAES